MATEHEVVTIEGRFWLADDRHRGYGRLELDLVEGARLRLVDTNLTERTAEGLQGPGPIAVLHGEALNGTPVTLLNVLPTRWRFHGVPPSGADVVEAIVERVIRGAFVWDLSGLFASRLASEHSGLKDFLVGGQIDMGPLRPADATDDNPLPPPAEMAIDLGDGHELMLTATRQRSYTRAETSSTVGAYARWHFASELPVETIERDYVGVLQDLVHFATRRQSYVTSLRAFGEEAGASLELWRRAHPRPRETPEVYALALNLGEVAEPEKLVTAWFDLRRRVGPVWSLFFSALDRSESLLEDRFLGLLAFAEGYHRALHDERPLSAKAAKAAEKAIKQALPDKEVREIYSAAIGYANQQTQRDRLKLLTHRAVEPLENWWYVEEDVFCARLSDTRNWMIHWGKRGRSAVEDPGEMVDMIRGLIVVLYVNVLLDLGLNADAVRRVIGSGWRLDGPPEDVYDDEDL